jgi:BlaI family transcriptional regulator, penicillinase repressor
VKHLLATFFNGSAEQAVASLLDGSAAKLSKEELDRLSKLIDKARKEGL